MLSVVILSILSSVGFGFLAIYFSRKEEKTKRQLDEREGYFQQKLYELSILTSIQDRLGYSLDITKTMDVLTSSLKNIFPYSTASFLSKKDNKLLMHTYIEDSVDENFLQQVKKSMLASLATILNTTLPQQIDETRSGTLNINGQSPKMLASFFHIPFVLNGEVVGLINLSSTQPGLYKEKDMTVLYQMIRQAAAAVAKLKEVIDTEKGRLLSLITSLSDGIFMIDETNQLSLINDAAKMLLGLQKENPTLFEVIGELSKEQDFGDYIARVMKTNTAIEENEFKLGKKILRISLTPVFAALTEEEYLGQTTHPKLIGVSVSLHDITLEKELSRTKEDFTNAIVHELRAPLSAIRETALLLQSSHEKINDSDKKLLILIKDQSDRLLDDIASILDAARVESGRLAISKKEVNLAQLINDEIALFKPQAQTKGIQLQASIPPNLPTVFVDPVRIGQVLNNLISNSLKFTNRSGTISIESKIDSLKSSSGSGRALIISVQDTGIGIAKEKQSTLFSKFSQVQGQERASVGSGLGLYIAKGIIEAHGGTIHIDSQEGKGTRIWCEIPIS